MDGGEPTITVGPAYFAGLALFLSVGFVMVRLLGPRWAPPMISTAALVGYVVMRFGFGIFVPVIIFPLLLINGAVMWLFAFTGRLTR